MFLVEAYEKRDCAILTDCALYVRFFQPSGCEKYIMESLILAQNERWRRVLSMQVERQG